MHFAEYSSPGGIFSSLSANHHTASPTSPKHKPKQAWGIFHSPARTPTRKTPIKQHDARDYSTMDSWKARHYFRFD